jgi:exonuclease SbcC
VGVITRVRLRNFTCHSNTDLQLPEGLLVFIGRNGAGKSSVVDAITYAFYGEHSREKNVNLVRDGTAGGTVELEYSFNGRLYKIIREFDGVGKLIQASMMEDGKPVVVGERKKEDGVTNRVASLFGLSYERMRSAVVIQQGELDKILETSPKALKELFDELLGLSKLETAYSKMGEVIKQFEEKVRENMKNMNMNYGVGDAERVTKEIEEKEKRLDELRMKVGELELGVESLKRKLAAVSEKLGKLRKTKELYAKTREGVLRIIGELKRSRDALKTSLKNIETHIKLLHEVDEQELSNRLERLEKLKKRSDELRQQLGEAKGRVNALRGRLNAFKPKQEELPTGGKTLGELNAEAEQKARRLSEDSMELGRMLERGMVGEEELRDRVEEGVRKLVGLVGEAYNAGQTSWFVELKEEVERAAAAATELQKELDNVEAEIDRVKLYNGEEVERLIDKLEEAKRALEQLGGREKIQELKAATAYLNEKISQLEQTISTGNLPSRNNFEGLQEHLQEEAKPVIQSLFENLEGLSQELLNQQELEELEEEYASINKSLGEKEEGLRQSRSEIERLEKELGELRKAREVLVRAEHFHRLLNRIRDHIFHRDGPVLKRFRAWIYGRVSERARGYLSMFSIRLDDVRIWENEKNEVVFGCSYGGREVDSRRLSGGERMALALAVRLAISDVLAAGKLGFLILDEPTVHLDSENRGKLREAFSTLARVNRQAIIITHDEEIFEGADAAIMRFERGIAPNAATEVKVI